MDCYLTFPIALQPCGASSSEILFLHYTWQYCVTREVVYQQLVQMFLTRKYEWQLQGGGRELINQMIHAVWNIRHQ